MSACVKCQAALKPNAKCCTQCGHRVAAAAVAVAVPAAVATEAPAASVCSECNAPLKANAKCCTSCGKRVVAATAPAPAPAPVTLSVSSPLPKVSLSPATEKKPVRASSPSSTDACRQCAAPLKANAKFCTNCGAKPERTDSTPVVFKVPEKKQSAIKVEPQQPVAAVASLATPSVAPTVSVTVATSAVSPKAPRPAAAGVATLQAETAPAMVRRKSVRKKVTSVGRKSGAAMAAGKIKCESCSHELNAHAVFCTKCGEQQKGSEKRIAMDGQACVSCSAALKPGMSFCTKCGVQVGAAAKPDAEQNKVANERRKKAALEAEKELEKHRVELRALEEEKITQIEAKRNQAKGASTCRKCSAALKPNSLFCTKCGGKNEKSAPNLVSLLDSFNTSTDQLVSVNELKAIKLADDEYAAAIERVKQESSAHLKQKEAELIRSLVQADTEISDLPADEDFAAQLSDLESKANEAEQELLQAMKAFQSMPDSEEQHEPSPLLTAKRSSASGPKVTLQDLDPAKFGIKSFSSLFADLEEETEVAASPSMSLARNIISKGEELRTRNMQERHKREEEVKKLEQTNLDDLDAELSKLMGEGDDVDLDDGDFAAVGGKYVRKVRVDSDDDSSDD